MVVCYEPEENWDVKHPVEGNGGGDGLPRPWDDPLATLLLLLSKEGMPCGVPIAEVFAAILKDTKYVVMWDHFNTAQRVCENIWLSWIWLKEATPNQDEKPILILIFILSERAS